MLVVAELGAPAPGHLDPRTPREGPVETDLVAVGHPQPLTDLRGATGHLHHHARRPAPGFLRREVEVEAVADGGLAGADRLEAHADDLDIAATRAQRLGQPCRGDVNRVVDDPV
ncbi:hypothetical protein [Pseudofrankia asymbiotica]|uniref:hypothetical protein n=1 Tax=Pseudofrankia asymbiotica TaxID=1834516 RepID=UPI001F518F54|nr:hypothetical protein [Pseudofrankia asymbiotica]